MASLAKDYPREIPLIQECIDSHKTRSSALDKLSCQMRILIEYFKKDKIFHDLADRLEKCDESAPDSPKSNI